MKTAFCVLALAALASAHTQEEINRKGAEVMEEYRRDRGHWVSLSDSGMVNHMVDHIGANGMAVAGFFIHKDRYSSDLPGEAEQEGDPLFVAYKKLAKDQSWLTDVMPTLTHKTWTFGYGHRKNVAEEAGCTGVGTWEWNHACIVVWKTSQDGTHMQTAHTTHFGHDHSKNIAPTAADIAKFIKKHAGEPVRTPSCADL